MKLIVFLVLVLSYAMCPVAEAKSYAPIGVFLGNSNATAGAFLPVKASDRPFLPGMRPVELELLEDALRRKMRITVGNSREKAHLKIIRNSLRESAKRAHIKGVLAEALYLEKNPNWGYVEKPNAPQIDVYTWRAGQQRPLGAQIKTHGSADPSVYAQDMVKDRKAPLFLVPDDHVTPLREHWKNQLAGHQTAGREAEAIEAKQQLARIRGLGFTTKDLDRSYSRAARFALREQYAGYISIGATAAMMLGPLLWDLSHSGSVTDQSVLRTAHGLSILAAERVATYSLSRNARSILVSENAGGFPVSKLGSGALRGSLRGNAIVGVAILATDTAFSIYEYGGKQAFQSEEFYANLGGGIGALPMGLVAGISALEFTGSPLAGFTAAAAVGTIGYLGGRATSRKILETINPEFLHRQEDSAFVNAKDQIENKITQLRSSKM